MNGELGVNLEQADIFGMRLGRTAAVVRVQDGKTLIDPIDSTLNSRPPAPGAQPGNR